MVDRGYPGVCKEDGCKYGRHRNPVPPGRWQAGLDGTWQCPECGWNIAPMIAEALSDDQAALVIRIHAGPKRIGPCGLCGLEVTADVGPAICNQETGQPVCPRCAAANAPELVGVLAKAAAVDRLLVSLERK
jgi:hypothetical protein